jgi:hypothetical protein
VWGDPNITQNIVMNGSSFAVTTNLVDALQAIVTHEVLTEYSLPTLLWVDAICINQTDIPERNSQVLIMRDIYRGASETLVWLGEADLDHGAAFNLLEDFCATQKDKIYQCVSEFKRDQDRFSWYPKGEDVSHMVVSADSVTDYLWVLHERP